MKTVFLVGDGMGDYPVASLGGRTPLQAADCPHMRRIAAAGMVRMLRVAPEGIFPGSDVCNLALLGYDPARGYTGRAPIEAAGAGLPLAPDDVAYRCNLVTVRDGLMADHSAGHIPDAESAALIRALQPVIDTPGRRLHPGVSYRHLLLWQDGPADITTAMPHEILGQPVEPHLPAGTRAGEVRALMDASREVLASHPVNQARLRDGKNPATQLWLWGQGRAMTLSPYPVRYGLSGAMITAVDLLRGLAALAGLENIAVPGATGFIDTNYEGKAHAAATALDRHDFVYLHVEAPDECGHQGDAALKTRAISDFDARIVGPVFEALETRGEPYRLVVTMDHRTPVSLRGHAADPVPLALLEGPAGALHEEAPFDETCNQGMAQGFAHEWVDALLRR
jgi:2,3-bisphosphoglycerate-independent phosphoglycerate mutase